ncbi:uncharacterized protein V1513DRAFT_467308 [Lipomyces chichibuensis]|uniref:uncharacterized protein n=1 Tax=Lipomyces chichibuensis TaxID=1546026 RepID=UPI003343B20E
MDEVKIIQDEKRKGSFAQPTGWSVQTSWKADLAGYQARSAGQLGRRQGSRHPRGSTNSHPFGNGEALMTSIYAEVIMNSGTSSEITRNLRYDSDSRSKGQSSLRLTSRAWDGALQYREGTRLTLMIAVEVGVSQSYDSLRAAISWSVCALRGRLRLAMSISEGSCDRHHSCTTLRIHLEEATTAVKEAKDDFHR